MVIDLHNDVMEKVVTGYELGTKHNYEDSDIPRFREGGIDIQFFALWIEQTQPNPFQLTEEMITSFRGEMAKNSAFIAQAATPEEALRINSEGKIAGVLGAEGGHAIENNLEKLRELYRQGVRYLTITWNNSTSWATSALDPQSMTKGLSDFGRQVVWTLDSLGMIIDVSHVGPKTIEDILQVTRNPIIASHSGVKALRNHYRNLSDSQIVKIARSGGVVGVVFHSSFLSNSNRASVDTVIKHIDYITRLVGVDYVALGSDFDGGIQPPIGLEDVSRYPAITDGLLNRGYSNKDIKKILGENFMRVFRRVCSKPTNL
jgi:membrane dipeptidase